MSNTALPKMSTLGGVKAVLRPNSPAVRVTTSSGTTSTAGTSSTPRAIVKVSTASAATTPKIQITVPPQPQTSSSATPMDTKPESEVRGIKREREDDDYDAA